MPVNKASILLCLASMSAAAFAADPPKPSDSAPLDEQSVRQQLRDDVERFYSGESANLPRGYHPMRPVMENAAYIGVSVVPAPMVLSRHLGLPVGMGLVVEFVAEKSPAEEAGVKPYDVLQKLDDQLLINSEQFSVLVRSYKPDDEVKLTIIRDGQTKTLTVKLAEHEVEALSQPDSFQQWELDGRIPRHLPPLPPRPVTPFENWSGAPATLRWIEGDRNYTITTTRDGHRTIAVRDRHDQILFEGPIDTKDQRDRLPTDIKEKVEKMMKSGLLPGDDRAGYKREAKPVQPLPQNPERQ